MYTAPNDLRSTVLECSIQEQATQHVPLGVRGAVEAKAREKLNVCLMSTTGALFPSVVNTKPGECNASFCTVESGTICLGCQLCHLPCCCRAVVLCEQRAAASLPWCPSRARGKVAGTQLPGLHADNQRPSHYTRYLKTVWHGLGLCFRLEDVSQSVCFRHAHAAGN